MHSKYNVTTFMQHVGPTRDKNTEKYPGAGHLFPQWSLYIWAKPVTQESCDPSSVLVCSDLHFCLTSFII